MSDDMWLEVYDEVSKELPKPQAKATVVPTLGDLVNRFNPLPKDAVLMGLATDDLPVLHNSTNTVRLNMLIEDGEDVLLTMSRYIGWRDNADVVVLSNRTDCWGDNVFTFWDGKTDAVIASMAEYVNRNQGRANRPTYLMVDSFENVDDLDFETKQHLRYILLRGHRAKIWVVASVNKIVNDSWKDAFQSFVTRKNGLYHMEGKDPKNQFYFWTPTL